MPGGTADASRDDDRSLLRGVAHGDAGALRVIYERCAGRALAIALRVLGTRSEAEEVVQEVFIQVWNRAREYDAGRGSMLTWILTIARSRAIDRLRTRGAQARAAAGVELDPAAVQMPSELAEESQLRARVNSALGALPAEQRRAIELAYFEGLSQSEIASLTGDPIGTVKTRVRLGMSKLAGLLDEFADGGLR
ncbi:MAG TPA: sigma-70 family RNA polymerase sigma factor [Candidatus Bathyarchaeia archaeon]|nr:sigma-70 family RNA polymerase sigma factor [Candidatus Bathyarchaeia archaeon]